MASRPARLPEQAVVGTGSEKQVQRCCQGHACIRQAAQAHRLGHAQAQEKAPETSCQAPLPMERPSQVVRSLHQSAGRTRKAAVRRA